MLMMVMTQPVEIPDNEGIGRALAIQLLEGAPTQPRIVIQIPIAEFWVQRLGRMLTRRRHHQSEMQYATMTVGDSSPESRKETTEFGRNRRGFE